MNSNEIAKAFPARNPRRESADSEAYIPQLVQREIDRGPMMIEGENRGHRVRGQKPVVLGDDPRIMKVLETAGVLRKSERLKEFYARTGLGPSQIMQMSNVDIQKFVQTVSGHETTNPRPRRPFLGV